LPHLHLSHAVVHVATISPYSSEQHTLKLRIAIFSRTLELHNPRTSPVAGTLIIPSRVFTHHHNLEHPTSRFYVPPHASISRFYAIPQPWASHLVFLRTTRASHFAFLRPTIHLSIALRVFMHNNTLEYPISHLRTLKHPVPRFYTRPYTRAPHFAFLRTALHLSIPLRVFMCHHTLEHPTLRFYAPPHA
jgi:hypothetical protein